MSPSPFSISKAEVSANPSVGPLMALSPARCSGRGRGHFVMAKILSWFVLCLASVTFLIGYSSEMRPDFGFRTEDFSAFVL